MKQGINILISGGGTGGHVFPAVAIADALKKANSRVNILFVGAEGRMEMERIPQSGYPVIGLPVKGFQRKLSFSSLAFFYYLIISIFKASKIIRDFRPEVVVGVGGYASGPVVWRASLRGIPVLIQEQNSYAGITNRLLSGKADRICVAWEGMEKYFPAEKILLAGNPVRNELVDISGKESEAAEFFGLKRSKKVILVLGGSLGAETINKSIASNIGLFRENDVELIWQTGRRGIDFARKVTGGKDREGLHVYEFISRMDLAYAAATLVISRAGAVTVSELSLTGKAAILVPSPNVAEDHQTKNAMALVDKDAAIMVKDSDAVDNLVPVAVKLANDKVQLQQLKDNILKLAMPGSAGMIADEILKLIKKHKG